MKNAPCKDCGKRKLLCHSTCEEYIAYDKYRKEINAKKISGEVHDGLSPARKAWYKRTVKRHGKTYYK